MQMQISGSTAGFHSLLPQPKQDSMLGCSLMLVLDLLLGVSREDVPSGDMVAHGAVAGGRLGHGQAMGTCCRAFPLSP